MVVDLSSPVVLAWIAAFVVLVGSGLIVLRRHRTTVVPTAKSTPPTRGRAFVLRALLLEGGTAWFVLLLNRIAGTPVATKALAAWMIVFCLLPALALLASVIVRREPPDWMFAVFLASLPLTILVGSLLGST